MFDFFSTPASTPKCATIVLKDPCMIADLHLDAQNAVHVKAFRDFMQKVAVSHAELVILGDFFDYWVGDDAIETIAPIASLLKDFTAEGKKLYLMHGNRDFMMGKKFAAATGASLLADPCVAVIGDQKALLAHGDIWCTKDHDYQAVRRRVRSFWWQWLVLRYPLAKRLSIAQRARNQSATQKRAKALDAMDVVNDSVLADLKPETPWVIHGHTHRPGRYPLGEAAERFVLADWHFEPVLKAGYLTIENGKPTLSEFSLND